MSHTRRHCGNRRAWAKMTGRSLPSDMPQDESLRPAIGALRAVEQALRQERVDRAWVDLDIAAQRLALYRDQPGGWTPAVERSFRAIERARDLLGRAQVAQAAATIAGALLALLG